MIPAAADEFNTFSPSSAGLVRGLPRPYNSALEGVGGMVREILRPRTQRDAMRMRSRPGSAYLGGGTWLNSPFGGSPQLLISLESLGLDYLREEGGLLRIGAMVRFQQLADNPSAPDALRKAVRLTASRTLRNMASIGGELALMPENSALLPLLFALDALVVAGGKKPQPMESWRRERRQELVTEVRLHAAPARLSDIDVVSRTSHSPRSLVVAASAQALKPAVTGVRLVVSDCRGRLVRLKETEKHLENGPLPLKKDIEEMVRGEFTPAGDAHASVDYKRYMAGVLAADILCRLSAGEALR
jgi:putative selenate reductase FAD-binding subunit